MARLYRYVATLLRMVKRLLWTVLLYVGSLTRHTGAYEEASSGPDWRPTVSWNDDEYIYDPFADYPAAKPVARMRTTYWWRTGALNWKREFTCSEEEQAEYDEWISEHAPPPRDARASPASCQPQPDPLSELQNNHVEPLMSRESPKRSAALPMSAPTSTQRGVAPSKGPSNRSSAKKASKHVTWAPSTDSCPTQAQAHHESSERSLPSRFSSSPASSATKPSKASVPSPARRVSLMSTPPAAVKAEAPSKKGASSPQVATPKSGTPWR